MSKTRLKPKIRRSKPKDAKPITETFREEYLDYYGKYVDETALQEFIKQMNNQLEANDRSEEIIRTVEDTETEEFIGVGAIKLKDNLAELGSTIIKPEYRSTSFPNGDKTYEKLFTNRLETAKEMVEDEADPVEIVYTQLLADKSAATQHVANKHNFAVTGVYDKKFPQAYENKDRVTVVDMLWADSNIENDQNSVFVPDKASGIVESALDSINDKRSKEEPIKREISYRNSFPEQQNYKVKINAVEDPMNFAEISVIQSEEGAYTWNDVLEEIEEAENLLSDGEEDEDYWVGVSLDANNPYCISAAEELEMRSMEYSGFNPGKLEYQNEDIDALEMQLKNDKPIEKHFINEVAEFIEDSGMEYSDEIEEDSQYDHSRILRI